MQLFIITGTQHRAKSTVLANLIVSLSAHGLSITFLDNGDIPQTPPLIPRQRLAGGCVCCALAASLIPAVWRLETDCAILMTSSSADPELVARLLPNFENSHIHPYIITAIDDDTAARFPERAARHTAFAQLALSPPYTLPAALPISAQ